MSLFFYAQEKKALVSTNTKIYRTKKLKSAGINAIFSVFIMFMLYNDINKIKRKKAYR